MSTAAEKGGNLGGKKRGVIDGLVFLKPASGLTATYRGGYIRVGRNPITAGVDYQDFALAGSTKLFTASKDTYVYVTSAGVITYVEKTLAAAKPTQDDIGEYSEWIAKVVTDGTDITTVQDLRRFADVGEILVLPVTVSFEANFVGARDIAIPFNCRVLRVSSVVSKALAGTDAGTVVPAIVHNGTAVTVEDQGGTDISLSHAASAAIGVTAEATAGEDNIIKSGAVLRLTTAKSTAGGEAVVSVIVEKL